MTQAESSSNSIQRGTTKTTWQAWGASLFFSVVFLKGIVNAAVSGWSAASCGHLIGMLLIPTLILVAVLSEKSSKGAKVVLGILAWLFALGSMSQYKPQPTAEQHVGSIANEVMNGAPKTHDTTPYDDALRATLTYIAEAKKTHAAKTDSVDLENVYSVESFAGEEAMVKTANNAGKYVGADQELFDSMQKAEQIFQQRLAQTSLSESVQQESVAEFHKSLTESVVVECLKAKIKWEQSVLDLYSFAIMHSDVIQANVKTNRIDITDDAVLPTFNKKRQASLDLRKNVEALAPQADKKMQDAAKEYGLVKPIPASDGSKVVGITKK